jgi:hypothetical protein
VIDLMCCVLLFALLLLKFFHRATMRNVVVFTSASRLCFATHLRI